MITFLCFMVGLLTGFLIGGGTGAHMFKAICDGLSKRVSALEEAECQRRRASARVSEEEANA
jgi:hypothetical protein